jgi:hypothetical protein
MLSPVLFRLALHRRMLWVLVLDPMPRAAGDIGRAEPLRHNALQDLRQVRPYQIAPFVQAECIAPRAVPVKLFLPFHHVCLAPVFLDQLANAIAAFAGALGAFDAEHVELALDVTEDEVRPARHDGNITPTGLTPGAWGSHIKPELREFVESN